METAGMEENPETNLAGIHHNDAPMAILSPRRRDKPRRFGPGGARIGVDPFSEDQTARKDFCQSRGSRRKTSSSQRPRKIPNIVGDVHWTKDTWSWCRKEHECGVNQDLTFFRVRQRDRFDWRSRIRTGVGYFLGRGCFVVAGGDTVRREK